MSISIGIVVSRVALMSCSPETDTSRSKEPRAILNERRSHEAQSIHQRAVHRDPDRGRARGLASDLRARDVFGVALLVAEHVHGIKVSEGNRLADENRGLKRWGHGPQLGQPAAEGHERKWQPLQRVARRLAGW